MKSVKKLTLVYEDFHLIGISSSAKDYLLCWHINKALGTNFKKTVDLQLYIKDKEDVTVIEDLFSKSTTTPSGLTSHFSLFFYEDEENYTSQYLIANQGTKGILIPEYRKTDFFLQIKGNINSSNNQDILEKLNRVEVISTAFVIDANQLYSKQNLLF